MPPKINQFSTIDYKNPNENPYKKYYLPAKHYLGIAMIIQEYKNKIKDSFF